ncbi:MAG TPA: long-chain fatty acid--CoA ligase [Candidatus Acidoferrum sp.]|nr:long-chain fatty acid--CoA ligase [Candidatus Acidoferrum sp.]
MPRFIAPLTSMRYSELPTMTYGTLPSRFLNAMDNLPNARAQMVRRDGRWEPVSSQEFLRRVAGLSSAFVELGVKPGDRVGLFSANRPEWHTADFAINGTGAITVPVYFHESPDRMTYILKHCGAKVVFVAGQTQLEKLLAMRASLPELENIVVADAGEGVPPECLRYETLIASSGATNIAEYRLRASQVLPGQLASIIYTSGTTGEPKGVMLTHTNFCSNVTDVGHDFRLNPAEDLALSFLPLSHVYGRTLDYIYIFQGCPVAYVPTTDEVAPALLEVQPTVVAAVPRVFEKIYARMVEQGSKAKGLKRKIFDWAMKIASQSIRWKALGGHASLAVKLQWLLADKLVYKKVRAGLGGRLRLISSGGAPLSKEMAEFFWAIDVRIYQGYGLTETSPIVSSNYPVNRVGSSGKPIANVQVRVAEDGEIQVKGPCIMQGYYKNPEATREVTTPDGWFRTGDIGYVDDAGYLYITDRKKDLIKTSGGKFVAPQPIENSLKTSPYILNAMVVGDRQKFIAALIVPNPTTVAARLADEGLKFSSNSELAAHPRTHALIEDEIKRLTAHLASYETIKRFALLPDDFSFDGGTLTFTLKLKRRVVEEQFRNVIESLYADVAEPRPILQE